MTDMIPCAFEERPSIVLTSLVRGRLLALADAATVGSPCVARFLHEELARADIIPEGTAGSVTMGSEVKFIDHRWPRVRRCKLTYPDEVNDSHSISVLTPIGSSLLGLGPGQSISWTDAGKEQRLTVLEVSPNRLQAAKPITCRDATAHRNLKGQQRGISQMPRGRMKNPGFSLHHNKRQFE